MRLMTIILAVFFMGATYSLAARRKPKKELNLKKLEFMLVDAKGHRVKPGLKDKKYILLYFSASWCPHCRKYTPELVKFYNKYKNDDFEIIFVSGDNSKDSMRKYMKEMSMPWPAVKYRSIKTSHLTGYCGPGIPCLVMLAPDGSVVADSYVDGKYYGPQIVVEKLKELLKKEKAEK